MEDWVSNPETGASMSAQWHHADSVHPAACRLKGDDKEQQSLQQLPSKTDWELDRVSGSVWQGPRMRLKVEYEYSTTTQWPYTESFWRKGRGVV